jgi:hypothetical protein
MTQTIDLPKLRTFDLLSPSEQAAIRRHCQNVVALALRRKYGTVAEHVPDPDVADMPDPDPEPAERQITPAQRATFYGQLNTHKQRNEPTEPEPQKRGPRPTGRSRRWTSNVGNVGKRGPKPMMGSEARR